MTSAKWKGYAYTYTYGDATVTPPCGTGGVCFEADLKKVCANGSVPADDKSGAGLGVNIAQESGTSTASTAAITGSVKIQLKGAAAGMRISLAGTTSSNEWCYLLKAADITTINSGMLSIPAASFATECWTPGKAYAGEDVKAIQVAVPGSTQGSKISFDFCVVDIGQ